MMEKEFKNFQEKENRENMKTKTIIHLIINTLLAYLVGIELVASKKWYKLPPSVIGFGEIFIFCNQILLGFFVLIILELLTLIQLKKWLKFVLCVFYQISINYLLIENFKIKIFTIVLLLSSLFTYIIVFKIELTQKKSILFKLILFITMIIWYLLLKKL